MHMLRQTHRWTRRCKRLLAKIADVTEKLTAHLHPYCIAWYRASVHIYARRSTINYFWTSGKPWFALRKQQSIAVRKDSGGNIPIICTGWAHSPASPKSWFAQYAYSYWRLCRVLTMVSLVSVLWTGFKVAIIWTWVYFFSSRLLIIIIWSRSYFSWNFAFQCA